jgi:hypothetical protein
MPKLLIMVIAVAVAASALASCARDERSAQRVPTASAQPLPTTEVTEAPVVNDLTGEAVRNEFFVLEPPPADVVERAVGVDEAVLSARREFDFEIDANGAVPRVDAILGLLTHEDFGRTLEPDGSLGPPLFTRHPVWAIIYRELESVTEGPADQEMDQPPPSDLYVFLDAFDGRYLFAVGIPSGGV